jgi:hypothetical protein
MDIETRLESLEDDIRRQKDDLRRQEKKLLFHKRLWMGAACLLVAVLLTWALPPPKIIIAQEFVVKDSKGEIHSRWGIHEGVPYFTVLDNKGTHELTLGFGDEGGLGLFLVDRSGNEDKARIFVGTQKEVTGITVGDKGGTPRLGMGVGEEKGEVAISIIDPSKNTRAAFFSSKEGDSNFMLMDAKEKIIWQALPKPK